MTAYRIALISDLHGNELALRQVLGDIRRAGVDQVACLGDVATLGPRPREVLAMVRESCDLFILGNHDEYLFDSSQARSHTGSPLVLGAVEQCRSELSTEEIDFVKSFERRIAVPLTNGTQLLLFHGSPDSNNCDLLSETPELVLAEHLGDRQAIVMAGGHTHIPMLRQHRGRWLVNPGSAGLAFERFVAGAPPTLVPHAQYAIVESRGGDVSVALQRVSLDFAALAASVRGWDNPLASYLAAQYASSRNV
jgi:predicted phosphodiesterase